MKVPESKSTWRFLIKHFDFFKLLTARFISVAGDNIHTVTTMLLVQKITGSALALGSVFIANTIPRIVFTMIGGVTVDRYDRKKILIICDAIRAVTVFALAFLALTNHIQVWHIAMVAAINGTASGFYPTAVSAVFPTIIEKERLQKANAIGSINVRLSGILGASVGGFLFALLGATMGYTFDAFSFLISALIILTMTIPKLDKIQIASPSQNTAGVWKDFKEGWGFVLKHQDLLLIVALSVAATFVSIPVAQLLPSFSANSLKLTSGFWFGFLWSGMSIGMLLAGFFLN